MKFSQPQQLKHATGLVSYREAIQVLLQQDTDILLHLSDGPDQQACRTLRLVCRDLRDLVDQHTKPLHISLPWMQLGNSSTGRQAPAKARELGAELARYHRRLQNADRLVLNSARILQCQDALLHVFMDSYIQAEGTLARLQQVRSCHLIPGMYQACLPQQQIVTATEGPQPWPRKVRPVPGPVWWHVSPHLASLQRLALTFAAKTGPLAEARDLILLPHDAPLHALRVQHLKGSPAQQPEDESDDDDEMIVLVWLAKAAPILQSYTIKYLVLSCCGVLGTSPVLQTLNTVLPSAEVISLACANGSASFISRLAGRLYGESGREPSQAPLFPGLKELRAAPGQQLLARASDLDTCCQQRPSLSILHGLYMVVSLAEMVDCNGFSASSRLQLYDNFADGPEVYMYYGHNTCVNERGTAASTAGGPRFPCLPVSLLQQSKRVAVSVEVGSWFLSNKEARHTLQLAGALLSSWQQSHTASRGRADLCISVTYTETHADGSRTMKSVSDSLLAACKLLGVPAICYGLRVEDYCEACSAEEARACWLAFTADLAKAAPWVCGIELNEHFGGLGAEQRRQVEEAHAAAAAAAAAGHAACV